MIIERLATKVAMEANAAMSRSRSVIVVSRVLLCFHFVLILSESQQENETGISEHAAWLISGRECLNKGSADPEPEISMALPRRHFAKDALAAPQLQMPLNTITNCFC
jgi:hypothetical protein